MNYFYIPVIVYAFFVFYLAAINVVNAYKKNRLSKLSKALCLPVVSVFYVVDVVFNWTLANLLFLDIAQERTVTERLNRLANDGGWRQNLSRWFARHWVNPFDLTELHVEYPGAERELSKTAND